MNPFDSFSIDKKSDIPIWVQLKQRLAYLIASGTYKPGDQLPTVRELAVQLDINYHTVNKVYHELEGSGLIEVQAGRGSHVADLDDSRLTAEEVVRIVADCLGVCITIDSNSKNAPMGERAQRVG